MVKYISHRLDLSRSQARHLLQGGSIKLNPEDVAHGNSYVLLSSKQIDKLRNSKIGGKLRLSLKQIEHNFKHGTGAWRETMEKLLKEELSSSKPQKKDESKNEEPLAKTPATPPSSESEDEPLPLIPSK
jgi:hypothetical protein